MNEHILTLLCIFVAGVSLGILVADAILKKR